MPEGRYTIEMNEPERDVPDLEAASSAITFLIQQLHRECGLEQDEIAYLLRMAADLLDDDLSEDEDEDDESDDDADPDKDEDRDDDDEVER